MTRTCIWTHRQLHLELIFYDDQQIRHIKKDIIMDKLDFPVAKAEASRAIS